MHLIIVGIGKHVGIAFTLMSQLKRWIREWYRVCRQWKACLLWNIAFSCVPINPRGIFLGFVFKTVFCMKWFSQGFEFYIMKPISRQPALNVIKEGVSENADSLTDPEDLKLVPPGSPSDLVRLRATASRLRLQTKRQSYINWKTNHYDNFFKQRNRKAVLCDSSLTNWSEEIRTKRPVKKTSTAGQVICDGKSLSIDEALNWIRNELVR